MKKKRSLYGREKDVLEAIATGAYNKERTKGQYGEMAVNKCNLFVDDVLQDVAGVKLPRYWETEEGGPRYAGWGERPESTYRLRSYLEGRSLYKKSGIRKVSREEAHEAANEGKIVIAAHSSHMTIMAAGDRPMVFRSDLSGRADDKRMKVGVGKSYDFFLLTPWEYTSFDEYGKQGLSDREIADFGEESERVRRKRKRHTPSYIINPATGRYENPAAGGFAGWWRR